MYFRRGLFIKEGVYGSWMMWLTASLADGQSPELVGKEHKQGLWWAAVTQNLPAEEQRGEREGTTRDLPLTPQAAWDLGISQGRDGAPRGTRQAAVT